MRVSVAVIPAMAVMAVILGGYMFLGRHRGKESADLTLSAVGKVYTQWKADHKVNIHAAEDAFRMKIFSQNLEYINKHNSKPNTTFKLGLNKFAHLTLTEFATLHFGLVQPENRKNAPRNSTANVCNKAPLTVPDSIDWQAQGKVSKVKTQGQCGSCYATAAVDAVESLLAIATNKVNELSTQQILDCSYDYGNAGCCGGYPDYSFKYIVDNGIVLESEYPYKGVDGKCNIPANGTKFVISGFIDVTPNDSDALKIAVAKNPVSAAIDPYSQDFQLYKSGIITADKCGTSLEHTFSIVGYGTQNGLDFWKIKNAWGPEWGDNGYVYLERTAGKGPGACGINMIPSYPTDFC